MSNESDGNFVTTDGRNIGGVMMEMKNITLRFGGVVALENISFNILELTAGYVTAFWPKLYFTPDELFSCVTRTIARPTRRGQTLPYDS